MASQIHFKFKSFMKEFESVSFSGMGMRLKDLKLAIADKKFGNESRDFDLSVTHAQTSQVFTNGNELIPKNTQVVVKRTSAVNGKGLRALAPVAAAAASSRGLGMQGAAKPTSALELAGLDDVGRSLTVVGRVAEAAAVPGLDALAAQSAQGKGYKGGKGNQWGKGGKGSGPGDNGTGEEQRRAPKGVPTKLLNFNEATGVASVRANDAKFQASRDKATTEAGDDALGGPGSRGPQDYGDALPPALQCPLCKGLVVDAVVLQWCRTSACDGCVRQAMRTNDSVCPITSEKVKGYQDKLVPNKPLRRNATAFDEQWRQQQLTQRQEREAASELAATAAAEQAAAGGGNGSGDVGPLKRGVDAELDLFRRTSSASTTGFDAENGGGDGAGNGSSSALGSALGGGLGGGGGLYDDFMGDEIDFSAVDAVAAAAPESLSVETATASTSSSSSAHESESSEEKSSTTPPAVVSQSSPSSSEELSPAPVVVPGPRPPPGPPPGFGFSAPSAADALPRNSPAVPMAVPSGRALEKCRDFARGSCVKGALCIYAHGNKPGHAAQPPHYNSTPPLDTIPNAALSSFLPPTDPSSLPAPVFSPVGGPPVSDTNATFQPSANNGTGMIYDSPRIDSPSVGLPPPGAPSMGRPPQYYGKGGKGYVDYGKGKGGGKGNGYGYGSQSAPYGQGKGMYGKGNGFAYGKGDGNGKGGKGKGSYSYGPYGPGQMGKGSGPVIGKGGGWNGDRYGSGPPGPTSPNGPSGRRGASYGYGDGPPQKRGKYGPGPGPEYAVVE